ncbi:MAG: thioredoxin domain-containing protein [Deltaproteobacteria bacterium]|nr:thioredoxin domain-containing protein [Deltaproteobacteria bacterium]
MKKPILVIGTVLLLALVFAVGMFMVSGQRKAEAKFLASANAEIMVRPNGIMLGAEDARVYLVEFLDPGCEACGALAPHVKAIQKKHGEDKVRLVIRYAPFHHGADVICRILEASRAQGKYWETLQLMFETQRIWADHHRPQPERIWELLPQLGLDLEQLRKDMDHPVIVARVQQDMLDARTLQVNKTPSFFVNGKPLTSFGLPQLQKLVADEVALQYGE